MKYLWVISGVLLTAVAQILVKKASSLAMKELAFFVFLFLGALCYVFAFFLYVVILKNFPLSVINPVMTLTVMILVVFSGLYFFQEVLATKQLLGIALGIVAVCLITL